MAGLLLRNSTLLMELHFFPSTIELLPLCLFAERCGIGVFGGFLPFWSSSNAEWLTATSTPLTSTNLSSWDDEYSSSSSSSVSAELTDILGDWGIPFRHKVAWSEGAPVWTCWADCLIAWGAGLPGMSLCRSLGVTERLCKEIWYIVKHRLWSFEPAQTSAH